MTVTVTPLLTVAVTHEFHEGPCSDLVFVFPAATSRLIKGARLVAKIKAGTLFVLATTDDAGAPIVSVAGRKLRFGLRPEEPQFANFTRGLDPSAGVLIYRNAAAPGVLDAAKSMPLVGRSLRHAPSLPDRPVTITASPAGGPPIDPETITAEHDRPDVAFDLSLSEPGEVRVDETYPLNVKKTAQGYMDPELASEPVLGVVEIAVSQTFYSAPPTFTIPFQARLDTLKYYVVTNYPNADVTALHIVDQGFTQQGRTEVKFTRAPSLGAADIPASLLGDATRKVILFTANAPTPRRRMGRRGIKLMRGAEVLIENLPQPGAGKVAADVIIHLSKP